ncbi:DUF2164 family protein [Candidatus Peregrinibacteria bacterium]|nr:DUF2164 family protein [Candidatus Peregrinibacteria bacterium]
MQELIDYLNSEHDIEVGVIGAEDILDFFQQSAGQDFYNKVVEDSREVLKQKFDDLDLDLTVLLKK